MCQQQLQQQHITQLHQDHFVRTITDFWVIIDKMNRSLSNKVCYSCTHSTAKFLETHFIPRWRLPDCIDSDQGTHFTGQVVKEVSRMLKIKFVPIQATSIVCAHTGHKHQDRLNVQKRIRKEYYGSKCCQL